MAYKNKPSINGFTSVELLVTILIAATFIIAMHQLYAVIERTNSDARQLSTASALAYSNLRTYQSSKMPEWFICNATSEVTTTNPQPAGQILISSSGTHPQLPGTVTQEVRAYAPLGCGNEKPVKVVSKVGYGLPQKEVHHATYTGR